MSDGREEDSLYPLLTSAHFLLSYVGDILYYN